MLEPYEIDQMSFLKDAATALIYGSAAGNGVVLVTTKGGTKNQKPILNYQGSMRLVTDSGIVCRPVGMRLMIWTIRPR